MKLLTKTNYYYLVFTSVLLLAGAVMFYIVIRHIIKEEVGEVLEHELDQYLVKAEKDSAWLTFSKPIEFEINPSQIMGPDSFRDTLITSDYNGEQIPYLQLTAYRNVRGSLYQITLRESLIESEDMLLGIFFSVLILFALLFLGLFVLNSQISRFIWKPFHQNLNSIKDFDLNQSNIPAPVQSSTDEFVELNESLQAMMFRMKKDYNSLKEFTENASHETQTPLAIIRANTDALLQSVNEEAHIDNLIKIEKAVSKLARVNQSLLLLTKIENNQFPEQDSVDILALVEQNLEEMKEYIQDLGLEVELTKEEPNPVIRINKLLANSLISNLIGNAIKHNVPGGIIKIMVSHNQLLIENTGKVFNENPEVLFERFRKGNLSTSSPGLGLSIVKNICDRYGIPIRYQIAESIHRLTLHFV